MRRPCPDTRLMVSAAMVVGLLLCLAPGAADGSILLPDDVVDMQHFAWDADGNDAASSSSKPIDDPVPLDDQYENPSDPLAQLLGPGYPTGNSLSGSSSSVGGASGAGSSAISSACSLPLSDSHIVGRTLSEQRFTLPMPPGNELLRPPQGAV